MVLQGGGGGVKNRLKKCYVICAAPLIEPLTWRTVVERLTLLTGEALLAVEALLTIGIETLPATEELGAVEFEVSGFLAIITWANETSGSLSGVNDSHWLSGVVRCIVSRKFEGLRDHSLGKLRRIG